MNTPTPITLPVRAIPTGFSYSGVMNIVDADDLMVAQAVEPTDAPLIIAALNAHDALMKFAKPFAAEPCRCPTQAVASGAYVGCTPCLARAALKLAKGGVS